MFDVTQFRQPGDLDDTDAFERALLAIEALDDPNVPGGTSRGATLFVPFGIYHLSRTLEINRQIILQGESGAGESPGSQLTFSLGINGIVVNHGFFLESDDGSQTFRSGTGDWTIIRDLAVKSTNAFVAATCPLRPESFVDEDDFEFDPLTTLRGRAIPGRTFAGHGIVLYARARIIDCYIAAFQFDGIHIESQIRVKSGPGINDITPEMNANNWEVHNCRITNNGRHGMYVMGDDANAGRAIGVDCSNNCRFGFYERSFLGNTYVGCHAADNGFGTLGGAYKAPIVDARNVLVGCYSEGGQNPSDLNQLTLVLGGDHGAGFSAATLGRSLILDSSGVSGLAVLSPIIHASRTIVAGPDLPSANIDVLDEVIFAEASNRDLQLVLPPPSNVLGRQYTVKRLDSSDNHLRIRPLNPDFPATHQRREFIDENLPGVDAYEVSGEFSGVTFMAVSALEWKVVHRMEPIKRGPPVLPPGAKQHGA